MILLSQILVGVGFVMALISTGGCLMAGGIHANPADNKWSDHKNWSWYMKLGWVAIILWLVGMFLIPFFK